MIQQDSDVPQRGVFGAFRQLCVFRRVEFALEAVEQTVDHLALPFVDLGSVGDFPNFTFVEDRGEFLLRPGKRAQHAVDEPFQPTGNIEIPALGAFQLEIIFFAVGFNLGGHAVKALRHSIRPREEQISNGSADSAIAVLKRMDRYEPEMRDGRLHYRIHWVIRLKPL